MNRLSVLALGAAIGCSKPQSELDTNDALKADLVDIGDSFVEAATAPNPNLDRELPAIREELFSWMDQLADVDEEAECFKVNWNVEAIAERHATLSVGFDNQINGQWFHIGYLLSKDPTGERFVRRTIPLFHLAGDVVCSPYKASINFRVDEGGGKPPYILNDSKILSGAPTPTQ